MPHSSSQTGRGLFGRPRLVAAGVAACLTAVAVAWADPTGGDRDDYGIALAVKSYLNRRHLSLKPLDDEISERCFKNFLETLDPLKSYFLQSDVNEFAAARDSLDDQINRGDLSFSYHVFGRFLERVDSRLELVDEMLAGDFDFTLDEEIVREPEDMVYPANEEEAGVRWRRRLKYDLLVRMNDETTLEEATEAVSKRYRSFAKRMHQIDNEDLREIFLTSLTTSYDPHTTYMSGATVRSFEIQMSLELEGIGAELRYEDGSTTVHKVVPGGAASKDGRLKVGDRIVGVAQGEIGEMVNVEDMKLSDVVDLIRGKKGTIVQLEVVAAEDESRKVYDITRDRIELKDKEAQGEVFDLGGEGEPSFKVGVIQLPSFYMDMQRAQAGYTDYKSTTRDMRNLLDGFKRQGVEAVVVDLRTNGGGSLVEAIDATGLFIDRGPVVQVRDFNQNIEVYPDEDPGVAWDGPLVVLISKLSASASEIFAGAIQDYGRGLLVGDSSTHGKGTVQSVFDLRQGIFQGLRGLGHVPEMGSVKLTTQQFYLPSGRSTQVKGVQPDVLLPSIFDEIASGEDDLDYAFEWNAIRPAEFEPLKLVSPEVSRRVQERSAARVAESESFQQDLANIEKIRLQKERKTIPLNEEKFRAEREQNKLIEHEQDSIEDSEGIVRDHYLDECLEISKDFVRLSPRGLVVTRGQAPAGRDL